MPHHITLRLLEMLPSLFNFSVLHYSADGCVDELVVVGGVIYIISVLQGVTDVQVSTRAKAMSSDKIGFLKI